MIEAAELSSQRPYLLRAMHEWITDNNLTPHIVVDAGADGLRVPPGHDNDGRLILNVSYTATRSLSLGNDLVSFEARFSGVPFHVSLPTAAVRGIYALETGQGMIFQPSGEPGPDDTPPGDDSPPAGPDSAPERNPGQGRAPGGKPTLKVVK